MEGNPFKPPPPGRQSGWAATVRTADLSKVYAAVEKIVTATSVASWKLRAFELGNVVWNGLGLTVMVIKPTAEMLKVQQQLIDAVAPYTVATGTAAAFATTPAEPDTNSSTIDYVTTFVPKSSGKNYIPHVTVGVASVAFVKKLEAEPFCCIHVFARRRVGLSTRRLRDGA